MLKVKTITIFFKERDKEKEIDCKSSHNFFFLGVPRNSDTNMSFRNNNNINKRFAPPQRSRLGRASWHHHKKTPKSINQPNRSKLRNAGRLIRSGYDQMTDEINEEYQIDEEHGALDGRTFTGHKDSISDTEGYIDHPMMITTHVEPKMNKKIDTMRNDQRVYARSQRPPPRRMVSIKARPMQRHRTFNDNIAVNEASIPQDLPLSMYGMTVEHYDDGYHGDMQDYIQPQQRRHPQTAFPSLASYGRKVDHTGIGLYITNSYLDHFSCTTLSYLIVGCILCIIIALVIAILVVAFTG